MSLLLTGKPAARGVVIGPARIVHGAPLEVLEYVLPERFIEDEVRRLRRALAAARRELARVKQCIPPGTPTDVAHFLESHIAMLRDRSFTRALTGLIRERGCNAEWALKLHHDSLLAAFERMEDEYLRSRQEDITQVVQRVLRHLLDAAHPAPAGGDGKPAIYVIAEPSPADLVLMHEHGLVALVSESGSPQSHTSILARSLGVAAVTGVTNARQLLRDAETLVVDGAAGVVHADMAFAGLRYYRARRREESRRGTALRGLLRRRSRTRDDRRVRLLANVELAEDLKAMRYHGAEGVGLYRTEFLYLNRETLPDEESLLAAYLKVLHAAGGRPVTIRTLDAAPRQLPGGGTRDRAANPALGLRGVRLCLHDPALFMPQLRALLRAAVHGRLRVMLPMVTRGDDLVQTRQLLEQARRALRREGLRYARQLPLGAMIEVPAAALAAHDIARHADFLSIGTNDLVQYTLAVDRADESVGRWHDAAHPAVLQLIQATLNAGAGTGTAVAMCGEMAGDPRWTRLLLGLGLREFSMRPASLLEVKAEVLVADTGRLAPLARRLLRETDPLKRQRLLERLAEA